MIPFPVSYPVFKVYVFLKAECESIYDELEAVDFSLLTIFLDSSAPVR